MTRIAIIILGMLFAGCNTTSAEAGWPHSQFENQPRHRQYKPVKRYRPRTKVIYRTVTQTSMTPGPLHDAPRCQPAFRTVGDQALSVAGAKEAAEKAFSQQARFSWGERFADVSHARDVSFECVRSSIGSVAGQIFQRCEMRARPCMAPQTGPEK